MKERARILLVVLCAVVMGGSAFAAVIKANGCLLVEDSRGRAIGTVIQDSLPNAGGITWIAFEVNGKIVKQPVDSTGLLQAGNIYFTSSDCTGTAYIELFTLFSSLSPPALFLPNVLGSPGQTIYVQAPGAQLVTITPQSVYGGTDPVCYTDNLPADIEVVQVEPLADVSTLIQPPLSLTTHGCQ